MSIAALKTPNLRVIPLREADFSGLERLFDEQCAEWLKILRWDYRGPSGMIREVAKQRQLPGLAITAEDEIAGCAFWIVEQGKCSVGDIYVAPRWREAGTAKVLVTAMLDELDPVHRLKRIESQCVNVGMEDATEIFVSRRFQTFSRQYMLLDGVLEVSPTSGRRIVPRDALEQVEIRNWRDDDFDRAAHIIFRSYQNEADRLINSQYRSEQGCADLLAVLTQHIWCGEFLPLVSRVAVTRQNARPVGVLISLRMAPGAGHLGQISILPEYQGAGIGRRLIAAAVSEFKRLKFDAVSLAVTTSNHRALRLYESCGFRRVHSFPVFFRER